MDYLHVRNWETFQHYKDRSPPWIKLHFELLTSADWVMLDDASKLLAVVCMLVASRHNGQVPNHPDYVRRVGQLGAAPDFKPLIDCGFLSLQASASAPLAVASPRARSRETDQTKKPETEKTRGEGGEGGGSFKPLPRSGSWNVLDHIMRDTRARCEARAKELNWDFFALVMKYNKHVESNPPRQPDLGFPAWVESFTKGKRQ